MKKYIIALIILATLLISCVSLTSFAAYYDFEKATVTLNYSIYSYTGSQIRPKMTVKYGSKTLVKGQDYKVSYKNNIKCGTATIKLEGTGNYDGALEKTFKIKIKSVPDFKATALSDSSIQLNWSPVKCDEYYIYRYDSAKKAYKLIDKVTDTGYVDTDLTQIKRYYYKIKAVKNWDSGLRSFSSEKKANCYTDISAPSSIKLATKANAVTIKWNKNSKATGYQIYRCKEYWFDDDSFSRIKTVEGASTVEYTQTKLSNDAYYYYKVRAYKTINDKKYYSEFTEVKCSASLESRLNAATLSSHKTVPLYNVQGTSSKKTGTLTLSDSDIKTLKAFASEHFESGMTREDKLMTTLLWINENVKYARGSDWSKISSKSYVNAVFNYKLGQCAQYNGAMAAMMAYLGYDARLVQGYRGTWNTNYWQHFWVEVKIDGLIYIMETGNYECDGPWYYCLARYSETSGYIKNQKNM